MNTNPLPDLSDWHPLPDDATVPEGMLIAQRSRDDGTIEVYPADEWAANPANRLLSLCDYFTPEPVQSPKPPLPTKFCTVIDCMLDGEPGAVLVLDKHGDWFGTKSDGLYDWVSFASAPKRITNWTIRPKPLDYPEELEKLRTQVRAASKATPEDLDEPRPVRRVELKIDDAGSSDPCGEESPDNIGYECTRTYGHDFLSLHSPNLHVASDYDGIITIWGEVS